MAFHKHVLISVVLLAISGILFGCGDSTVAPRVSTEAPIVAPSNVTAEALPSGDVVIRWDANTQPNFKGYNVYRLDRKNQQIGKLNVELLSQNSYTDTSTERYVEYEYRITSVSVKGVESNYSSIDIAIPEARGGEHRERSWE